MSSVPGGQLGTAWAKGVGTGAKGPETSTKLAKKSREADEPEHGTQRRAKAED